MAGQQASKDTYSGLKYLRFSVRIELNVVDCVPHGAFEACRVVQYYERVEYIDEGDGEVSVYVVGSNVDRIVEVWTTSFT